MEILGKDVSGQEIIPIAKKLVLKTNRHPNTDGTSWGWIEGCSKNICWSDNNRFNEAKAFELVKNYNSRSESEKKVCYNCGRTGKINCMGICYDCDVFIHG